MMTEKEAAEKWCPQARVTWFEAAPSETTMEHFVGVAANRHNVAPGGKLMTGARCIGSACMWWRWRDGKIGHSYPNPERRGRCGMISDPG